MFKRTLPKPDGRLLHLYGRAAIPEGIEATSPKGENSAPNPHLRWHPLRGEWVAYASHRQNRTFLPPPEWTPLAPSSDSDNPTEVPAGAYDVAVFENRFPTLYGGAHDPPRAIVETRPGKGACEVVVFTQDRGSKLGALPLWHIELLFEVWADRTRELGARDDIAYVFPFENRGVEVGVTLHHPHGQIYAYPFVPAVAARELEQQRAYFERNGRGLLEYHHPAEIEEGARTLYTGDRAVALLPVCARYAYEIWVAPKRGVPSLTDLDAEDRRDLARALKTSLLKLDALFSKPMPYIMAFHQAPSDGAAHPEAHVHIEIYPYLRMPSRLKYLAGSETGAGAFTADTLPEEKAAELRAIEVDLG
jgi:UDPglucose--hexose-1-phosphate uridylyltransferase